MKIHHIGIACEDIDTALEEYAKHFPIKSRTGKVVDPLQNATVELVETDTNLNVEFIEGEKISTLVQKGVTYYHLCYEVENLDATIKQMSENGAMVVAPPQPARLFNQRRVAFLFTSSGLVELLEE